MTILPISISATLQELRKEAKFRWFIEWVASPHYKQSKEFDQSPPSPDYLHIVDQLKRNQASLLTQFRPGHVPLNEILYRIKQAPSPDCPHCGTGFIESIFHFLLACPHYSRPRGKLLLTLNEHIISIPFILGNPIAIPHFLRYVSETKRLRSTFGEVRPKDNLVILSKSEIKLTRRQSPDDHEEI